jgi:hypothetical protein
MNRIKSLKINQQNCISTCISTCEKGFYEKNRIMQINGGQQSVKRI